MPADTGAPPNPYSNMAAMPGPMPPPKKDDKAEEVMKGMHGVFKALSKMDAMAGTGGAKEIAAAKKSLKDFVANVLKGDPSTLEDDGDKAAPPPPTTETTAATPPPDPAAAAAA
jgi:hypothetical protein